MAFVTRTEPDPDGGYRYIISNEDGGEVLRSKGFLYESDALRSGNRWAKDPDLMAYLEGKI